MGATYTYTCQSCGYSANVSGGPDVGFVVKTQTGFCSTCNELIDYVTEVCHPDGDSEKDVVLGACHKCRTPVEQNWHDGDACPRCGGAFGERSLYENWD